MNKFFIVLVFIATSSLSVSGQVNDAGLWTSLGLKSDLGKKFSLDGDVELRFNENVTELGTIYGEALLGYKFNKRLEGSIGYRLIGKRRFDDRFSIRHRVLLNLSYKKKFNKVTASFRARYQSQFSDIKRSENWRVPDDYFRFKATFKYDTDKKEQENKHLLQVLGYRQKTIIILFVLVLFAAGLVVVFRQRSLFLK